MVGGQWCKRVERERESKSANPKSKTQCIVGYEIFLLGFCGLPPFPIFAADSTLERRLGEKMTEICTTLSQPDGKNGTMRMEATV
jgi:hypothetical protein